MVNSNCVRKNTRMRWISYLFQVCTETGLYGRIALCLCAMVITGLATAPPAAAQGNNAVATVNGVAIPQSRLDFLGKTTGQPETPELSKRLKDELINGEVVAQEAVKKGFDKTTEFAMQMELQRQNTLIRAYLQDYLKAHPIDDVTMKKEYDRVKAENGDKEYKARHILVETQDEAKQIIAELKKSGGFDKVAAEKSKDTNNKGRGGDLGWSPAIRYVPPFAEALRKLKVGQITETPVQTQFGWHVIQLDDERVLKFPSYEEAKPQLQQEMQQETVQKVIADLRAKANIE
jgi:peptidyl-prolyl cis-trans isomerase C